MLAIATSHPRFYQQAVKELKKEGVSFLSLRPEDEIPPGVDLIITSPSEKHRISFPKVVAAAEAAEAVQEAIYLKTGLKRSYKSISIGVDPGKSIGVVAMGDLRVIREDVLATPSEVVSFIKKVRERFSAEEFLIKVGASGGAYRNRIISSIQRNFDYPVEIVDEGSTTQPKEMSRRMGLHKDVFAARRIASKKGRLLTAPVKITSTPGEIKNIQRESRKKSAHLTISKKLAEAVVKGELDIDEAIKQQKKGRDEDLHSSR